MPYNELELRPLLTRPLLDKLKNGKCWHFDAWLLYHPFTRQLYMRWQSREGGRILLLDFWYRVVWDGTRYTLAYHANPVPDAQPVIIQGHERYADLNDLHWRLIFPMSQRRPDAYLYTSARLHYIGIPSLSPIDHTMQNYSPYAENATS